jgi:hypothetical protein
MDDVEAIALELRRLVAYGLTPQKLVQLRRLRSIMNVPVQFVMRL